MQTLTKPMPRPSGEGFVERDDVHVQRSPFRCPFCHVDLDPHRDTWTACGSCLAWHHAGCWEEGSACSACGHAHVLKNIGAEDPATSASVRAATVAFLVLLALLLVGLFKAGAGFLSVGFPLGLLALIASVIYFVLPRVAT